jgi:ABC-2 type transport system ATP-binding protein
VTLVYDGVTFGYRRGRTILNEFSWAVPNGRTVLLGPNGAGKSTVLALGADALRAQRGEVRVHALRSSRWRDRSAYRRAIGWMPQTIRAVPGVSAREQVAYAGWLKGLTRVDAWRGALDALVRVALAAVADQSASTLSGGQLRRLGLAQVLVHSAEVLLLDEPAAGLDPAQRARFRELIASLPAAQPVVVSTHQVDDLSELFDTVVILDAGTIRFAGSVASFLGLAPSGPRQAERAYAQVVESA